MSPSQLTPSVPRNLETICLKCLRKDPRLHYDSAEELADDLRRFLDGRPIRARPLSAPRRLLRWCRRNPLGVTIVALLTLLAAGSWGLLWTISLEKDRTEAARRQADDNAADARRDKQLAEVNATRALRERQRREERRRGPPQARAGPA